MTPSESDFGQLLEARTGAAPRRSGREYIGLCPVHGDKHPSLSFREGDNGKILTVCRSHACSHGDIAGAIGWEGDIGFDSKISSDRPPRARYDYHDAAGKLIASKVRRDTDEAGKKCYWEPKLNGRAMPLYRLPEVLKARAAGERVFLCEGERDAETLRGFGLVATTSPHGAVTSPSRWLPEHTETLAGADVVIVPDNDEPGRTHGKIVADQLRGRAKRRILPPFLGRKGFDLTDAVSAGLTREAFLARVEATTPEAENSVPDAVEESADEARGPRLFTVEELLGLDVPPLEYVVEPLLREKGLAMLYAARGLGKTWVTLSIALAAASGMSVFGAQGRGRWFAPKPRRVLLVDGEMPLASLKERISALVVGCNFEPDELLRILAADHSDRGLPPINTAEGQALIASLLEDGELLILDNISSLTYGLEENSGDDWEPVARWLLTLRRRGCPVLMVHHASRNDTARGTSRREDILDTLVTLKRPEGYSADEGARMVVSFQKNRGFAGKAAEPFELELRVEHGAASWTVGSATDAVNATILEMYRARKSLSEIGKEVGLDKSNVKRRLDKLDVGR